MWSWAFAFAKAFYVSGAKAGQSAAQGESVNHGAMQKRIRGGIQPNKRGRAIHRAMQKQAQGGVNSCRGCGFTFFSNVNTEFQDAL